MVVFASKKGGNLDLYQSSKNVDGEWSKATALNINSEQDEDSPYIFPSVELWKQQNYKRSGPFPNDTKMRTIAIHGVPELIHLAVAYCA